ncbi:hypothetical protein BH09PSE6_BH09PSE6_06280 [soil metagenome]
MIVAPLTELVAAIDAGRITDVKTIIGAYWAERQCRAEAGTAAA